MVNEDESVRSRTGNQCGAVCCVANLDGECVFDKCEGALIQMTPCPVRDKELRRKYYDFMRNEFNRDFCENITERS